MYVNSLGKTLLGTGAVVLFVSFVGVVSQPHDQKNDPQKQLQQAAEQAMANQEPVPLTPAEEKKIEAEQKKAAAEQEAANEQVRLFYAKSTEDRLLSAGYNVDVTAYGPKHKYLKLRWVLASKVTAYQFSHNNSDMWEDMRKAGFAKFTITDGYDFSWYWDLTK